MSVEYSQICSHSLDSSKKNLARSYLIGVFFLALTIRVIIAFKINQLGLDEGVRSYAADAPSFDDLGWQIAQGLPVSPNWFSPGYTLFIAFIYKIFGHNGLPVMLMQSFMGACVPLFVFGLARFLFGLPSAIIASSLTALSRLMIPYSINYFSESPTIFFLSLFLFLMTKYQAGKWYLWSAALCLGLASFFRMPVILFTIFIMIWMLIFFQKKIHAIFLNWLFFSFLVFLPTSFISYRNYSLNKNITIGTNYGQAVHVWGNYDEYGLKLNSLGFNPFSSITNSFGVLWGNPGTVITLWAQKVAFNFKRFFWDNNFGVIDAYFIPPGVLNAYQGLFQISWIIPIFGLLMGIKIYWIDQWSEKKPEAAIFTLTVLLFFYYAFMHSIFFYCNNRFRMPVHFIVLILSGTGLGKFFEKIQSKK